MLWADVKLTEQRSRNMWTPMLAYHAGKGRELELERQAAARAQLEEAIATQQPQQSAVRPGPLQRLKKAVAPMRRGEIQPART
jgi:hypothetical protein